MLSNGWQLLTILLLLSWNDAEAGRPEERSYRRPFGYSRFFRQQDRATRQLMHPLQPPPPPPPPQHAPVVTDPSFIPISQAPLEPLVVSTGPVPPPPAQHVPTESFFDIEPTVYPPTFPPPQGFQFDFAPPATVQEHPLHQNELTKKSEAPADDSAHPWGNQHFGTSSGGWPDHSQENSHQGYNNRIAGSRSLLKPSMEFEWPDSLPVREFGFPPTPKDLGFPGIGSTQDNWLYDVDWTKLQKRRRKRRSTIPTTEQKTSPRRAGASRRQGQQQEYEGPYIYTQLFGPPYEVGYIRSPIPSKHVYEDYLQFVRSWSSASRDAVDQMIKEDPASVENYKTPNINSYSPKKEEPRYTSTTEQPKGQTYSKEETPSGYVGKPSVYRNKDPSPAYPVEESYSPSTAGQVDYNSPQTVYEAPETEFRPSSRPYYQTNAAGAKSPVYVETDFKPVKSYDDGSTPVTTYRPGTVSDPYGKATGPQYPAQQEEESYEPPSNKYDILKPFEDYYNKKQKNSNSNNYGSVINQYKAKPESSSSRPYPAQPEYQEEGPSSAYKEEPYRPSSTPAYQEQPYSKKESSSPAFRPVYPSREESYPSAPAYGQQEESVYSEPPSNVYKEEAYKPSAPAYQEDEASKLALLYKAEPSYGGNNRDSARPSVYKAESYPSPDSQYSKEPTYGSKDRDSSRPSVYKAESYTAPDPQYGKEPSYGNQKDSARPNVYKAESYPASESQYDKEETDTPRPLIYRSPAPVQSSLYKDESYQSSSGSYQEESNNSGYQVPTRYVEPPPYASPKGSNPYKAESTTRPYNRQQEDRPPVYVPTTNYAPPSRKVEPPAYSTNNNKYDVQQLSGTSYQADKAKDPAYNSNDYDQKKPEESSSYTADIGPSSSYKNEASSTETKKHYPVIIGRYQVTDSRAFLPQKVEGSGAGKSSIHGANGEEYVVYYLPYGQPLPVPVRRKRSSGIYLRSLADRLGTQRQPRGDPEEIQEVLTPEDVHKNLVDPAAVPQTADSTGPAAEDVPSGIALLVPVQQEGQQEEVVPLPFSSVPEEEGEQQPPPLVVAENPQDAPAEPQDHHLPQEEENPIAHPVQSDEEAIEQGGISTADFSPVAVSDPEEAGVHPEAPYPHHYEPYQHPAVETSTSRILPGLTQRPVKYIKPPGLAEDPQEHWNGYSAWWTKLGNRIAKIYNYE